MQAILGANGQIAIELAKELKAKYTSTIRLVSRNPKKINETDSLFKANLLDAEQTNAAVDGAEIVYLTVGLPLDTAIWEEQFPVIMQNVINACKKHKAKLVFFDNTYMYPQTADVLTENTIFKPNGRKGKVRAQITQMLLREIKAKTITAVICRAPEFYGPGKTQSYTNSFIFKNIKKGKKLKVLVKDSVLRTLIWTPDASRAVALIGNTSDAYMQTWHLPCDDNRLTYKQFITLASKIYGQELKYSILSKLMLRLVGLFKKTVREIGELIPRYEVDTIFDSTKFKNKFPDFRVTTYQEGIEFIKRETELGGSK